MSVSNAPSGKKEGNGDIIAGLILILLGIFFLIKRYFPEIDFSDLWPWILIVVGVLILYRGLKKD